MTKHFAIYKGFKQNALFQAAYILIAAIFTWALAMALLKRRELAGKALQLERFQARLLDNLPDGLLIVSPDNVIRAANPAAHDVFKAKGSGLADFRSRIFRRILQTALNIYLWIPTQTGSR